MIIALIIYIALNIYSTYKTTKYLYLYYNLSKNGIKTEGKIVDEKVFFDSLGRVPIVEIEKPQSGQVLVYWVELILIPFSIGSKVIVMIDSVNNEIGIIKSGYHLFSVISLQILLYLTIFFIV